MRRTCHATSFAILMIKHCSLIKRAAVCSSFLSMAVLIATGSLLAQSTAAKSFGTLKKDFDAAWKKGNVKARVAAVTTFSQHAHPETVRYLLKTLTRSEQQALKARASLADYVRERSRARREVRSLRSKMKAGKGGSKRKLAALEARLTELQGLIAQSQQTIKREDGSGGTIRKGVGWVIQRSEPRHQKAITRILTSEFKRQESPEDQAQLLRVMVWTDVPELRALVMEQTKSASAPLRVAALRALEERGGAVARDAALGLLEDEAWPVRAQAVRILRQAGGAKAAMALTEVMAREDGRLVTDAVNALRKITGQDFFDNSHLWREWLNSHSAELPEPTERANAAPIPTAPEVAERKEQRAQHGTGFYGINTKSKHIVYVLDFSGSMNGGLSTRIQGGASQGPAKPGGPRKIDGVAKELLSSVMSLSSDSTFAIVRFATGVEVWRPKMQQASQANKQALKAWLLEQSTAGSTNLHGGLVKAFDFAGRGSFDKHYASGVDTIFLLSDGSPTAGEIQAPDQIVRAIGELNDLKRIAIHCVGLGRSLNTRFLQALASENDGSFVHVTR